MTSAGPPAPSSSVADFLSHPDLAIRLIGGAIWVSCGIGFAASVITLILTLPTLASHLIRVGAQIAAGL